MKCRRARQLLSAQDPSRELRSHVAACPECDSFRRRVDAVVGALGDHHVAITPPPDFVARVRRSLQDDDPLAWAALRLLPATLGLVLLLSWLNLRAVEPAATESTDDPTTVVLNWVLDPAPDDAAPGGDG